MHRIALLAVAALLLPAVAADAAKVSGKAPAGYTVVALAPSGQAVAAKVSGGRFAVAIPASGATLHLVAADGGYFGPVVLRKKGKKGIVALSKKGGAIGRIAVRAGWGSAKAPRKAVSARGAVKLRKGAPLGAGTMGYVKLRAKARMAQNGDVLPGADPDGDAVPSTFDADDNGNGTLDVVDPATARNAGDGLFSTISAELAGSVNVNAGGVTRAQVDAFVQANAGLNFFLGDAYARGRSVSAVNVDCGVLSYCRPGAGTATIMASGNTPEGLAGMAWTSLDTDADGFPDVPANTRFGTEMAVRSIAIAPNATTAQIGAGDLFQVRFTTPEGPFVLPTSLSLLFVTTPAVASVDGTAISYPAPAGAAGTAANPIRMTSERIALRVWRPQRSGIGGEDAFVDMGRLNYGIPMTTPDGSRELGCGASSYHELSDTLRADNGDDVFGRLFPLSDSAADGVSGQLGFTFDVGACLRANGVDPTGRKVALPITAVTESRRGGTDRTTQIVYVCLPGCATPSSGDQQAGSGSGQPGGDTAPAGDGAPPAPSGKPDLAIDAVTGLTNAGNCDVTVTIANRGTVMAPSSTTRVELAGGAFADIQTESVDAGGQRTITGTVTGVMCFNKGVTATADQPGAIDEYQEDNNQWSGTFGCTRRRVASPRGC